MPACPTVPQPASDRPGEQLTAATPSCSREPAACSLSLRAEGPLHPLTCRPVLAGAPALELKGELGEKSLTGLAPVTGYLGHRLRCLHIREGSEPGQLERMKVSAPLCHCVAPLEHLRRFSPLKRPSTRQGKVGGPWQKASLQAAKAGFLQHGAISTADQPSLWRAVVCTVQDLAAPLASPHCVPVQEWQPKFLQELLVSWRKVLGAPIPTPIRMTTLTGGPSLGRDTETEIRLHRTLAK